MRVTKNVRLEDLGLEFQMLAQRVRESAVLTFEAPWIVVAAKSLCPVDTSALMESVRAERRGPYQTAIVAGGGGFINPKTGREVDYARFVHDGTSKMPARPFLLQAILAERLRFAREMIMKTAEAI